MPAAEESNPVFSPPGGATQRRMHNSCSNLSTRILGLHKLCRFLLRSRWQM